LAAVGVLATNVALGVRGLGTFVTVSVDREGVGSIGIIAVVFIPRAVAVGRITAGNRGLETCDSVARSWACSRNFFFVARFGVLTMFSNSQSPGMLFRRPVVTGVLRILICPFSGISSRGTDM